MCSFHDFLLNTLTEDFYFDINLLLVIIILLKCFIYSFFTCIQVMLRSLEVAYEAAFFLDLMEFFNILKSFEFQPERVTFITLCFIQLLCQFFLWFWLYGLLVCFTLVCLKIWLCFLWICSPFCTSELPTCIFYYGFHM